MLVGDSKQLEAVGSASTLHMLTQHLGAARLEQIARQRSADDRAISQAWFSDTGDAPTMMQRRGLLRATSNDQASPIELMLTDASKVHKAGTDWSEILLLADRNSHVNQLNQRVREIRMLHDELDKKAEKVVQVTSDRGYSREIALCPGDRIMLRKNSKLSQTPVFNGDRATVISIEYHKPDTDGAQNETVVHARLDRSGTEISWRLSDYDKLDHAYAMTVHKSQGLTVEHAFYVVSETTDRRSAYVAFTRSKAACPFYLSPECESTFANRTSLFKAKKTALDADPGTKQRTLHTPIGKVEIAARTQQPGTKELLEKTGIHFSYPGTTTTSYTAMEVDYHQPSLKLHSTARQKLLLLIQRLREHLKTDKSLPKKDAPSQPRAHSHLPEPTLSP